MRNWIFDFDGTICDSYVETLRVLNELAPAFRFRALQETQFEGLRDQGFAEFTKTLAMSHYKIPFVLHFGRKLMRKKMHLLKPFGQLPEVILELKSRGYFLGILTTNSQTNVEAFLRKHGIHVFDFVRGGSSVLGKARLLEEILQERGLSASNTVYVGDEARDIVAARRVGVRCIAVTWGFNSLRLIKEATPDLIVSSPTELLNVGHLY